MRGRNNFLMINISEGYESLRSDFQARGIPTDSPGLRDHQMFLKAHDEDRAYLNKYAAFVVGRPYDAAYLQHARTVITNVAGVLFDALKANGRLGACVDITGHFSRILEKEGIWSCGIKGSLAISFPLASDEVSTHLWSVGCGGIVTGHAWLFAPPFSIVDVAIRQQAYGGNKCAYLPDVNLVECPDLADVEIEDVITPEARAALTISGVPRSLFFSTTAPGMRDVLDIFSAHTCTSPQGAVMKYCPMSVLASDSPLEIIRCLDHHGRTPYKTYQDKFLGCDH